MNINFICFNLSGHGGTERAIVNLANYLQKDNKVRLLLSNSPTDKSWLHELNPKIKVKEPKKNNKVFKLSLFTKYFLKADNQDVFIILGANTIKLAAKLRKALHKKWRIISWMHFSLVEQDMFDPQNILYADEHLSISSKITNQLINLGAAPEKIYTIYNVIPKHSPLPANGKLSNHIIFAGRVMLKGQKNLKELFDAFKETSKNNILDIFGSGDIEECKKYALNLGISDRIIWHGWVNSPLSQLVSRPKCVVLTSKFEGLPMIFLEAMSYGIPCVSSEFDGFDDVIQEKVNGFSYPQGKNKVLAKILSGNELNCLSSNEVSQSIEKFYDKSYYQRIKRIEQKWEANRR